MRREQIYGMAPSAFLRPAKCNPRTSELGNTARGKREEQIVNTDENIPADIVSRTYLWQRQLKIFHMVVPLYTVLLHFVCQSEATRGRVLKRSMRAQDFSTARDKKEFFRTTNI
jgi:hypothetical protein